LRSKAHEEPRFADAASKLDRFAEWARQPPFAFYARVLGAEHGRKRFLARLGHEAEDALDEFLNLALEYERRETPSVQGFIAWLRTARTDVKRDMEITRDEVRVMTVHGAKGLEAPIVVLADTTTEPAGPAQRQPRLVALANAATPHSPHCLAWIGVKATDTEPLSAARERVRRDAEDEYRRLLYVAMTRAADRLVVCGAEGERAPPEGCWWNLVSAALKPLSVEEPADDGDGKVWRYRKVPPVARQADFDFIAAAPAQVQPPWLDRDAPMQVPRIRLLSPASAYDEAPSARVRVVSGRIDREKALARGVLVHRLLQSLPDIAPERRTEAARRHLARAASALNAEEREHVLEQISRVLEEPRFAQLFLPGSRAEVPIVGRLAGGMLAVSGQVDRLAVTRESVLIADYKTNRPAPQRLEDVPAAYVTQLALYRAVLGQLYPDKAVRAALIWTDVPDLMEISAASLEAALAAVTST
jgi:ATP-dependent helicase/nuclease subunit A